MYSGIAFRINNGIGTVKRKKKALVLKLIATLKLGEYLERVETKKEFIITLLPRDPTPDEIFISEQKDELKLYYKDGSPVDNLENITKDLSLPRETDDGAKLEWSAREEREIWLKHLKINKSNEEGLITRPFANKKIKITLKAIISKNGEKESKAFKIQIPPYNDEEREELVDDIFELAFYDKTPFNIDTVDRSLIALPKKLTIKGAEHHVIWETDKKDNYLLFGKSKTFILRPKFGEGNIALALKMFLDLGNKKQALLKQFNLILIEKPDSYVVNPANDYYKLKRDDIKAVFNKRSDRKYYSLKPSIWGNKNLVIFNLPQVRNKMLSINFKRLTKSFFYPPINKEEVNLCLEALYEAKKESTIIGSPQKTEDSIRRHFILLYTEYVDIHEELYGKKPNDF